MDEMEDYPESDYIKALIAKINEKIEAKGARLIAVSPELYEFSEDSIKEDNINFSVLTDLANKAADEFGLVFELPHEYREIYKMLNIISARCRNRGIGLAGTLPWRFKKDLQYFKDLTIGDGNNAVVVGNSTYRRLPCLPKRDTLVLTNNMDAKTYNDNVYYFNSIPSLYKFCDKKRYTDIWIAGGENVYRQFLADSKNDI